ncbi:ABC transporter permease subunit [Nonomuraea jabiensis]|uniref:Raffinose/stachyose/melibiose transport system permease protein n=1 Tax=Nonomuraea jabiensis TaxID=882448 RepID=A0A7W9G0K5_9ACTN|nr:ABC transporter permease subunit [Nonomuraea jabiensis]MBB5775007.1 raffinose/stachyose/melibiose transport system permease protein [Nonomuraea jabiensis]
MRSSARGWSRLVHPAVVIILTAVVIGIPLWLALVTSAKSQGEANLPDLSLPRVWHLWDNYSQAFTQGRMLWALFGSLLVMVLSVAGMMLVYMGMYMSLVIFFVTGFVRTIPVEVEEAARMDGARPLGIFIKVVLPLLRPVIATATILICLYIWNDVFYAFFVLGGGTYSTLPLNL